MEIIRLIALLLSLSLLLCSCAESPSKLLSYQEKNFRAHVSFQLESLSIGAVITSRHEPDYIIIEFTSPPSLSGITVKKCGGTTTVTLGDMQLESTEYCRLAEISSLFEISGVLRKSSVESISGKKFNRIELFDTDKNEGYTLYLYKDSGLPHRIVATLFGKEATLDVVSFEFMT